MSNYKTGILVTSDLPESVLDEHVHFHLNSSDLLGHHKWKSFPISGLDNYNLFKA